MEMNPSIDHRSKRPLNRRIQARMMRILNIPMRMILGLPFPTPLSNRLMLLSYVGRKSGKAYRQPVSYVQEGNDLLTPGGGNWKWNMKEGQSVRIHLRGREVSVRPELISDPGEVESLLGFMTSSNPGVAVFTGINRDPDGHFNQTQVKNAVNYGFRIVRWHIEKEEKK